mmetsp:Transcript_154017/g.268406  ORF Transcript_154017/g.268406 Transcript_154017/m.268406 type:complete len:208 (+) Transcript_154017:699-1322(+)
MLDLAWMASIPWAAQVKVSQCMLQILVFVALIQSLKVDALMLQIGQTVVVASRNAAVEAPVVVTTGKGMERIVQGRLQVKRMVLRGRPRSRHSRFWETMAVARWQVSLVALITCCRKLVHGSGVPALEAKVSQPLQKLPLTRPSQGVLLFPLLVAMTEMMLASMLPHLFQAQSPLLLRPRATLWLHLPTTANALTYGRQVRTSHQLV